ncbi:SDR family oxidoreductase [Granulicella sp. S190]|uniref:SDR family oxidoreductase n=1 Tax=Granulicella sp. S190 TaxID=1747226 RepID=UPI00131CC66A|nr:SDR family oxidoreductase [Granulicella sp. S190]
MDRFKGKTAVITGGTTGIGLATAKLFINEGARVIVTGRTPATIKSAQAELGDNAIVVRSDATSFPDMDALAAKVKETFGKLDVLFVNAGYGQFIPFESVTEEVYDEMLNLNAKGPYFITQKLVPLMPEGSSVVFTTSMANVKAVGPLSAYGAAKAALRSITRSLASELYPRGIRVNAVSPGPIEATDILQKVGMPKEASDQVYVQMAQAVPMKRLGRPEELARAVAFLAIDATYTTGIELPVDGGWSQL